MAKWSDKNRDELIYRMFRCIARSHFRDHKMVKHYCSDIQMPRSLGEDIAGFVQAKNPELYHEIEKDTRRQHNEQP